MPAARERKANVATSTNFAPNFASVQVVQASRHAAGPRSVRSSFTLQAHGAVERERFGELLCVWTVPDRSLLALRVGMGWYYEAFVACRDVSHDVH